MDRIVQEVSPRLVSDEAIVKAGIQMLTLAAKRQENNPQVNFCELVLASKKIIQDLANLNTKAVGHVMINEKPLKLENFLHDIELGNLLSYVTPQLQRKEDSFSGTDLLSMNFYF